MKYFEHVEEAVWAVEVLKESGLPVAATLAIGPEGDVHGVPTGECAVRLAKAGKYNILRAFIVIWLCGNVYKKESCQAGVGSTKVE